MKKFLLIIFSLILLTACLPQNRQELIINNINMKLTSPVFIHNSNLPSQFTCDGQRINPPLEISEVPAATKSLALIVDDPDAPVKTFVHWLVWNIDPKTEKIDANSIPASAKQGTTSAGKTGYFPPCPPSGTHRYVFKLFALDTLLSLTPNAGKDNLEQAMQGHILDSAELIGLYKRQ